MYTIFFLERLGLRRQHGSAFVVSQGTKLSCKNVELKAETLETRTTKAEIERRLGRRETF